MVRSFQGVTLNHIARETQDVQGTGKFYMEIFGFEPIETPSEFGDTVIWLKVPPAHYLHIIKRHEDARLPESPFTVPADVNISIVVCIDVEEVCNIRNILLQSSLTAKTAWEWNVLLRRLDESALQTAHHLSFRVAGYDAAVQLLKEKNIKYFEKTQQEGTIKQCFFFDPDGNGLEIGNWPPESK